MSKERDAEIMRQWNVGLSSSAIAEALGVSASLVSSLIRRRRSLGETTRTRASSSANDERNAKIVNLWNSGLSTSEVARHVGCTRNVVLATIVKHRALGDITRPAIYSRVERGKLSKFGEKMKPVTLRQHQKALPPTAKDPRQSRAHTIASVVGRGSANPQPVTLSKVNTLTLAEIEQKYKDI